MLINKPSIYNLRMGKISIVTQFLTVKIRGKFPLYGGKT
jgi:hypothetical protein